MRVKGAVGVLAGNSHLASFGVPLRKPEDGIELLPLIGSDGDFLCLHGAFPWGDDYWTIVETLAADYKLFICYRGNQHFAQHVFASDPLFDFILANEPNLPIAEGAVLVPERMVRASFLPSMIQLETLLKNVMNRAHHGVVICGTPPPKGDHAVIRSALGMEPHFVARLAALGSSADRVALTPPWVLYKMWRIIQDMLRDVARQHGAAFCPVPSETQTTEGFLREEFWSADVTHANHALGRLMLPRLRDHL